MTQCDITLTSSERTPLDFQLKMNILQVKAIPSPISQLTLAWQADTLLGEGNVQVKTGE